MSSFEVPTILIFLVLIALYAVLFVVTWKFLVEPLIWRLMRRAMQRSYERVGLSVGAARRQADRTMRENWDVAW